jgi:hypothetical protein
MPINSDWDEFARSWIAELSGVGSESQQDVAVAHASDEKLGHIAAGPVEHLLGKHGEQYIENVEQRAEADPKFEVWARVEALKARYSVPTK